MLTNEQIAHDLTIAMIPIILTSSPLDHEELENGNLTRNPVDIYLKTYQSCLNELNKKVK